MELAQITAGQVVMLFLLIGTGMLYLECGLPPGVLKDGVCSPGGTTIRGVAELEKRGYHIIPESVKYKGDRMTLAYLEGDFGGFAVHLVHK